MPLQEFPDIKKVYYPFASYDITALKLFPNAEHVLVTNAQCPESEKLIDYDEFVTRCRQEMKLSSDTGFINSNGYYLIIFSV